MPPEALLHSQIKKETPRKTALGTMLDFKFQLLGTKLKGQETVKWPFSFIFTQAPLIAISPVPFCLGLPSS